MLPFIDPVLENVKLSDKVDTAELERKIMEQNQVIQRLQNKGKRKKQKTSDAKSKERRNSTEPSDSNTKQQSVAQDSAAAAKPKKPKSKKPKVSKKSVVKSTPLGGSEEPAATQKQVCTVLYWPTCSTRCIMYL